MTEITDHLGRIRDRVRTALTKAGRPTDAAIIIAVSKEQPASAIEEAFLAGQRHFGESYVQEAVPKMEQLQHLPIEWHFIGRVQTNKTRAISRHFGWVHAVDRARVALRLSDQRPPLAPPLNVLLQVNQAGEAQKAGVEEVEVAALARAVAALPRLRLRGLTSIPPGNASVGDKALLFARLRALKEELDAGGLPMDSLSMGMSADFEAAIAEGATCVRIGAAIFGRRKEAR